SVVLKVGGSWESDRPNGGVIDEDPLAGARADDVAVVRAEMNVVRLGPEDAAEVGCGVDAVRGEGLGPYDNVEVLREAPVPPDASRVRRGVDPRHGAAVRICERGLERSPGPAAVQREVEQALAPDIHRGDRRVERDLQLAPVVRGGAPLGVTQEPAIRSV